jgi:hypothetical protein
MQKIGFYVTGRDLDQSQTCCLQIYYSDGFRFNPAPLMNVGYKNSGQAQFPKPCI